MRLVCGDTGPFPNLETHFLEVGKWTLGVLQGLRLIGRIARVLLNEPLKAYVGFDRHLA